MSPSSHRRVRHFDRLELKFDKSTLRTNPDGSRTIDGFGAHVGNYTYHDDKGQPFVEHVPATTLFDAVSLESAAGSTLTIRHGPGLVTPDRYRAEAHGSWVKAWDAGVMDGVHQLGARLRLGSEESLAFVAKAMDAGEPVELSPVYEVDVADTPGTTAEGHHDAVQRDRLYSGIALLGPDEARGGPGTRLQLDGPECAPEGSRIQVKRAQLDSAPRVPLHSATGRPNMKHATISSGGRSRRVSADTLVHIRAAGKLHSDATSADQIETGTLTVEIEGEEPAVLVLPVSMIEMLLEGIGASPAAPVEAAPLEDEPQAESLDADDDEKLDAKIRKVAGDMLDLRDRKLAKDSARSASVHADAATILPPGYSYDVHWTQVALDAIAKVKPELEADAKKLAARVNSTKGDAVAEGMLRQMLAERRTASPAKLHLVEPKTDQADANKKPWASDTMPSKAEKQ